MTQDTFIYIIPLEPSLFIFASETASCDNKAASSQSSP